MGTPKKMSVAVVEEQPCTRLGLAQMLTAWPHGKVLFTARDGMDYEAQCDAHGVPDLVLLALRMPRRDGWELLDWMGTHQQDVKRVVITGKPELQRVHRAWQAKVNTILTKRVEQTELVKALEDIRLTGHHQSEVLDELIQVAGKPFPKADDKDALLQKLKATFTKRQYTVLRLLVQGLTVPQVARKLKLAVGTVRDYRDLIYARLDVHTRAELVLLGVRFGLVKA